MARSVIPPSCICLSNSIATERLCSRLYEHGNRSWMLHLSLCRLLIHARSCSAQRTINLWWFRPLEPCVQVRCTAGGIDEHWQRVYATWSKACSCCNTSAQLVQCSMAVLPICTPPPLIMFHNLPPLGARRPKCATKQFVHGNSERAI